MGRAAIESCAENFSDGVIAPVFWYVLFGFPGLLVYKAINTLDSMIGYKNDAYRHFGKAAARLDDVANLVPARLSGLLIVIAACFTSKANPKKALKIMLRDAGKHRSPNAGWPEGAMAGALTLSLAGPRNYRNATVEDPWIGEGTPEASEDHIDQALSLYRGACLANGALVALILAYAKTGWF